MMFREIWEQMEDEDIQLAKAELTRRASVPKVKYLAVVFKAFPLANDRLKDTALTCFEYSHVFFSFK
jgi:hypothetical protein